MIAQASPKPSGPTVQLMTVTPSMAARWLEGANGHNRALSEEYAAKLARDIREGRWFLSHEGIAFDTHGVLLDGQHRLWAVVLADKPIEIYVWVGISPEALLSINSGKPRSLADNLRLGGGVGDVTGRDLATLRAMLGHGTADAPLTPSEAKDLFARHREAVTFAGVHLPKTARVKGLSTGDTRAVVARAFYSAAADRLAAFCGVLRTSIARGELDEMVVVLRQYLTKFFGNSHTTRQERYSKMERVLLAYLRGERMGRIYAAPRELFPLPEESAAH
jgi:hypothetical protein